MVAAHAPGARLWRYKHAARRHAFRTLSRPNVPRTGNAGTRGYFPIFKVCVSCVVFSRNFHFAFSLLPGTRLASARMWWAIWCAAVVAGSACAEAAPSPNALASAMDWEQLDSSSPEDESLGYAAPSMGGRNYAGSAPWLYLLTEVPRDSQVSDSKKLVRSRRTFSVNPAVEVLQREAFNQFLERQAHANRNFLNCVGKRDPWSSEECTFKK
ncbi:diuretic hormone 1 isoform X3 [Maniola jurtina]|uniref:diuretic hormone 1 isoform X3 n=1 Tax=Maniola jurtina TaxID=191418 RepID=UPI001E68DEAE|nr:diuretic hormone 1 isoform X3 [Maniola jurtina]